MFITLIHCANGTVNNITYKSNLSVRPNNPGLI